MCDTRTCAAMAHVRSFNSKLVRIRSVRGAMNCATTSQEDKGFNSKLVRIRRRKSYAHMCSNGTCAAMAHVHKFQFQTGSIRSPSLVWKPASLDLCFNSKLVRLEVYSGCSCIFYKQVSIPNWFD